MAIEQDAEQSAKNVAFYAALVDAWVATRMEKDKTLLTLATGGVGLLVTLLTTVGPSSGTQLWLYGLAGTCFGVAVVAAICVFDRNSHHLLDVIQNGTKGDDERLQLLDQIVFLSFVTGMVLTGAIALSAGYSHMHRKGAAMTQESREITMTTVVTDLEKRSLTGIVNLAPGTAVPQPASTSNNAGATPTPSQTGGTSQGSPK
jgi:hypothetical protein